MYYDDRFIKNSIILQRRVKCGSECQGCTKLYTHAIKTTTLQYLANCLDKTCCVGSILNNHALRSRSEIRLFWEFFFFLSYDAGVFLNALYSANIFRLIKSSRLRWTGLVAHMREERDAYRVLVGKHVERRLLRRPRNRWKDNIKIGL